MGSVEFFVNELEISISLTPYRIYRIELIHRAKDVYLSSIFRLNEIRLKFRCFISLACS